MHMYIAIIQSNLYLAITLGEWQRDRSIQGNHLIQVAQNTLKEGGRHFIYHMHH